MTVQELLKDTIIVEYAKSKIDKGNLKLYKDVRLRIDMEKIKGFKELMTSKDTAYEQLAMDIGAKVLSSLDKNINK